jgi:predicted nucleic acid-binding protein
VIPAVLFDTGPLVALLDRREEHHNWVLDQMSRLRPPFYTCEAVIAESWYLLRENSPGRKAILGMLSNRALDVPFRLTAEICEIEAFIERYENVPMSLADACLVRMSELMHDCVLFTLDSDFRIYRRNKRERIPLLIPPDV